MSASYYAVNPSQDFKITSTHRDENNLLNTKANMGIDLNF